MNSLDVLKLLHVVSFEGETGSRTQCQRNDGRAMTECVVESARRSFSSALPGDVLPLCALYEVCAFVDFQDRVLYSSQQIQRDKSHEFSVLPDNQIGSEKSFGHFTASLTTLYLTTDY